MHTTVTQHGLSLLETLIALLLFSIGILTFADAELMALRHEETAYFQNIASTQLTTLSEKLLACRGINACYTQEIYSWENQIGPSLPHAENKISSTAQGFALTLKWQTPFSIQNKNSQTSQFNLQLSL